MVSFFLARKEMRHVSQERKSVQSTARHKPRPSRKPRVSAIPDHFSSSRGWTITTVGSDSAKARALAHDRIMLHRQIHANLALVRRVGGASCRRKDCVSEDHRPPTSLARTTSLALPCAPESSGYTRSFLLRAARKAAPSSLAQRLCGTPLRLKGDTRVVSTASCAPWKSGRPSATTSNRRASARWGGSRSRSRTSTFVDTRAPASRQTRAAALSRAYPRRPNTPACAQAARWWPLGSSGRPHRQKREEGGKGSQRRRRSSMRNKEESSLDKRDVGKHKNGTPANGPPCDLKSACSVTESLGLTVPSMRIPWTGSVAVRCHPWRGMPGSMSTSCTR